ncbi:hypothetical protein IQ235_01410, partial [Oscillatoriales cyanobacterium LEGE 11467]
MLSLKKAIAPSSMSLQLTRAFSLVSVLASFPIFPQETVAQIVPDASLPTHSTVTIEDSVQ